MSRAIFCIDKYNVLWYNTHRKAVCAMEFKSVNTAAEVLPGEAERTLLDELLRREQHYLAGGKMYTMDEVDDMMQELLDENHMVS